MPRLRRQHVFTPLAFLSPALIVLGVFFLWSMGEVAWRSFTRWTPFSATVEFVGLENYRRIIAGEQFWTCLLNSIAYLLVTPVILALSLGAALLVDAGLRGARGLRLVLFLPVVTPTIVAAIAWSALLREDGGVINTVLNGLGLDGVAWLTQRPWSLVSAMMVTVWKGFGFYMLVFLAGLVGVPAELKEAARLDGASPISVFRHVTLPALWPSITLVSVVSSIAALKVFEELFVTIKGTPPEHQTLVPLIYLEAFERGEYGMACALGLMLFTFILGLSLLNLRLSRRREQELAS